MRQRRDLSGPTQRFAIRDLLQSLFVAELVRPSRRLWLLSAWVSDIPIVENSAGQFASLAPDWPASPIGLARTLATIAALGGNVTVVARDDPHNVRFIEALGRATDRSTPTPRLILTPEFHEKGLVGDDYVLSGSMNFTVSGVTINEEHVVFDQTPEVVHERQVMLLEKWRDHLP